MSDLQEFKCPCCGGSIEFNSESQKMQCPYCDTEFDAEALKSYDNDVHNDQPDSMNWTSKAGTEWNDGEENGFNIYACKSCGGEIIGDEIAHTPKSASSVMEIVEEFGLKLNVVSLAKREEEVFLPNQSEPVIFPRTSPALYLFQRIRDEAHRFAITFHKSLRAKEFKK